MDAVQFGRWFADRRRTCGWASQRSLALAAQAHPRTSGLVISEAFLARLEAGLLVHPFRGAVRRRVVGSAWLLCSSARQVRDYVKVADLGRLTRAEAAEIDSLVRSLSEALPSPQMLLPPPPPCLLGRDESLAELMAAFGEARRQCCLITGMPGVGKTSLAVAVAHQLAGVPHRPTPFADGIVYVTCDGRHGTAGLSSILEDVLASQQSQTNSSASHLSASARSADASGGDIAGAAYPGAANRARRTLAGKRLLIVLDGIEPDLPFDRLLDALLPHGFSHALSTAPVSETLAAPVLLITSRSVPLAVSRVHHLHLQPLPQEDGVRLIEHILGTTLDGDDREAARRLCAATGGQPLAIETAATTLAQTGIPIALLAEVAERKPLAIFDGAGSAENAVASAVDALPIEIQTLLALVSVLQAESFDLAAAAALRQESQDSAVAITAALVRRSLLEPVQPAIGDGALQHVTRAGGASAGQNARFRLPALVRAYAAEKAGSLPAAVLESASEGLGAFADTFIERHAGDVQALASEAEMLWAALNSAVHDGTHARTLRLVRGLLPLALQRDTCGQIEQLARVGIHAGKAITDRRALETLLNVVGIMRYFQDDHVRARRAWAHCIQLAGDLSGPDQHHTAAYFNLAMLADREGDPDVAWHLAELGVHYHRKAESPIAIASALLIQAERARRRGKQRIAHTCASEGMDLILASGTDKTSTSRRAYIVEARLELARIARDYASASAYAEQSLAFTGSEQRLFLAEDLIDQAEYALEVDANQDAVRLAGHVLTIANDAQASALSQRAQAVRQRAERPARRWRGRASGE